MNPARPGRRLRRRGRLVLGPNLLLLAFVLLLGAWVGADAPGNAPDEPANYLKAIGAGTGQGLGQEQELPEYLFGDGAAGASRAEWISENSRSFLIPAGLIPDPFNCYNEAFLLQAPTTCTERVRPNPGEGRQVSYVGTYPPYVFAVPGVVMAHMPGAVSALYAGRFVLGFLTALLLAIAVRASWSVRAGPVSLLGTALAVSPMVLFLGTSLGANGIEAVGALALFTVVLRSARPDPPRWLWPAGFAAAAASVLARPTGLLWLVLALMLAAALHGARPLVRAAVRGRGRLWSALTVVPVVAAFVWDRLVQPHPAIDWHLVRESLTSVPADLRRITVEWVGVFGWASLRMTPWVYRIWLLLVAVLVLSAVLLGRTLRERLLAPGVAVVSVVLVGVIDLLVFRQTYFPVYGRYTLPLGVLVPLVAGHVVVQRLTGGDVGVATASAPRGPRWEGIARVAPRVVLPVLALVQLCGIWTSARRAAVSVYGPAWFFGKSQFAPPGGWGPWLVLALAGTVLLALAGWGAPGGSGAVRSAGASSATPGDTADETVGGRAQRRTAVQLSPTTTASSSSAAGRSLLKGARRRHAPPA